MVSSPLERKSHADARDIKFTLLNLEVKVSTLLQQYSFFLNFLLFTLHAEMHDTKGI